MARRVFFSFHYGRDVWRVGQVRNSWLTKGGDTQTFLDAAAWETIKRRGQDAVEDWIDRQLNGTGVTVVLIGSETANRHFVRYEIRESHNRGNGMLGIRIHKIRNQQRETSPRGRNPFTLMTTTVIEKGWFFDSPATKKLSEFYRVYDWIDDDGYTNMPGWIEQAAREAGR